MRRTATDCTPARRQRRLDLAPQHGRKLEAHNAVEHAACLLCIHQVDIYAARPLYSRHNSRSGNFVKNNAAGMRCLQTQHLEQMPGNGFTFTVFIGSQPHTFCLSRFGSQLIYQFFLFLRDFVYRPEAVCYIYTEILFLEVAYVSVAGQYLVVIPQKLADGLGLGGGLNDYQIFLHNPLCPFMILGQM